MSDPSGYGGVAYWQQRVERAEAERDRLREDVARLDWIAENSYSIRNCKNGRKNCAVWHSPPIGMTRAEHCRAAIDKARKGEKP